MVDAKIAPKEETKDAGPAEIDKVETKRKKPDKDDYLRNAETEEYADDSERYKMKVTREERIEYWQKIVAQGNASRKPKKGIVGYQEAWMKGDYDYEGDTYPGIFVLGFNLITTKTWDYLYLFLFFLYLVIVVAVYDGLATSLDGVAPDLSGNSTAALPDSGVDTGSVMDDEQIQSAAALGLTPVTMLLPLIFMVPLQLIPGLGMFYYINRCNDLCKYKASRTQFGSWAFVTIFIAQSCEYFFYGGVYNEDGAGKCAYGKTMMKLMGRTKLDLSSLEVAPPAEESDGEEDFEEDELPEGYKSVEQRIDELRAYAAEHPEDEEAQKQVVGEEMISFLQKIKLEKEAVRLAELEKQRAENEERQRTCEDWTEWTCLVCNTYNRRPTHPVPVTDIYSGTKGVFYKREFAILKPRRDAPRCSHCLTYSDYKPPLGSAHMFPHNTRPYRAFSNFPKKATIQAGLDPRLLARAYNYMYSCCFGTKDNSSSALVYNDWRLRIYLNGRFPMTPRQVKPLHEYYRVGEFLECKLQRSDWNRCQVVYVRKNHTYDIKYDAGDQLRLVGEEDLRLPPEKRGYAYKVELCMLLIVFMLPICVIASMVIRPGLLFFPTFLVGAFLTSHRLLALSSWFRQFHHAGLWPILKTSAFFTMPCLLMLVASVIPLLGMSWTLSAYAWIAAKLTSLPILYIMKPMFCIMGSVMFFFTSCGFFFLARFCDGDPIFDMMAINMAPLLVASLLMMYYRRILVSVIDVNLVIRPPLNFIKPEPWYIRLYNFITCVKDLDDEEAAKLAAESRDSYDGGH